jgi:hypothetical protein
MPWHLSRSDPRKVYDGMHQPVCVCQTMDQAALIVRAVNALGPESDSIRLREQTRPEEKESAQSRLKPESGASEHAKADAPLTHVTVQAEGCCAKQIAKASLSGVLDRLQPWECPKCGTTYWPRRQGFLVINWEARAAAMVFRP